MHRKLNILLPPGGHIELRETPWQAIAHELEEESGYQFGDLQLLQPPTRIQTTSDAVIHPQAIVQNTHPISKHHYHSDTAYGFIAQQAPSGSIADGESTDVRWLTVEEMKILDASSIFQLTVEVYDFIFNTLLDTWDRVDPNEFQF